MTDILQVKQMLAARAQAVAEHLLPGGRKDGHEWRCGSLDGGKGQSLGVHLSGQKAGLWADFNGGSDDKGDLLDLWRKTRRIDLAAALDEARSWLGVSKPEVYVPEKRSFKRPEKPKCHAPKDAVHAFLTEDRNIPQASIDAYKVAEDGRRIVFPYLRGGELIMVKWEGIDLDTAGKKVISSTADTEDCLFGWQAIAPDAREVVITEGEKDALSWHAYGFPALSVPRGGGAGAKQKWIENEFDRMARFERIYLATDMDEAGETAAVEIATRLGRHRCLRVVMPRKDANDCLMNGVPQAEMAACIRNAKNLDPDGLRWAHDYADDVVALFWPPASQPAHYGTPYAKLAGKLVFRPGEVTIWTGASGAGKSQILNDCIPGWIKAGSRICLSSLEMKPAQTLRRLVKQIVDVDRPSEPAIRAALKWAGQGLLLYELIGKKHLGGLLEVFEYARAKYGCDQFIIDSLMRLGIAGDDYTGQEKAVFEIVDWTIRNGVHTHLVAHARKGEKGAGAPETEDIKGAMEIGANAFNILTVWRNKAHEEALAAARTPKPGETDDGRVEREKKLVLLERTPAVILNVAKQRNGDFEGKTGLWFDQATYRYRCSQDPASWKRRYLPDDWNNASPGSSGEDWGEAA